MVDFNSREHLPILNYVVAYHQNVLLNEGEKKELVDKTFIQNTECKSA
jgi:hypothetical protein